MEGAVTAYSGATLTINITKTGGSGTHADWNFSVSGVPGAGDMLAANNLSDVTSATAAKQNLGVPAVGQCRLIKSGSNVVLLPFKGNMLTINGTQFSVPDAGVSLAPTGLTATTLYYIYAFMSSGTMTLEASTTGHATDTTAGNKGVEIKSGDSTRTLVGQSRPITGPAFADTATQRFVVSWFNRRSISLAAAQVNTGAVIGSGIGERKPSNRCEFLTWADEAVSAQSQVSVRSTSNGGLDGRVNFDGATFGDTVNPDGTAGNFSNNNAMFTTTLSEGYHFSTWDGSVQAGSGTAIVTNMAQIQG